MIWRRALHKFVPIALVSSSDRLIVPEQTVYALSLTTGVELWAFHPSGNASLGEATISGDKVFFGTDDGMVYALSLQDGTVLWKAKLGNQSGLHCVIRGIAVEKGFVYVSAEDWNDPKGLSIEGILARYEEVHGQNTWTYNTRTETPLLKRTGMSSTPILSGGFVFVGDTLANNVRAVDNVSGMLHWIYRGEVGYAGFLSPPVLGIERIYGGAGTKLVMLDTATGFETSSVTFDGTISDLARCGSRILVSLAGRTEFVSVAPNTNVLRRGRPVDKARLRSRIATSVYNNSLVAIDDDGVFELACDLAKLP